MKNFDSSFLFRNVLLSLIPTATLITLCYFWADPAFAFWMNGEHWNRFPIFDYCTHFVDAIMVWSFFYYCYFAWIFSNSAQKKILPPKKNSDLNSNFKWPALNVANSVAISIFIKDALKAPFGRYWPSTWTNNNPSLIHDHAYGFHWFHKGVIYQSFPSGHTTVGVAFMVALWFSYPRSPWRWFGVFVACAIVMGLLVNNYHFIGDCLAGAWIGAVTAIYVTSLRDEIKLKV